MKISIAMTTYNGSKYILEQLLSIDRQTVYPDEIIIHDDCSTDDTATVITDFINALPSSKQERWSFMVNPQNKGWRQNYYDVIKETTGDVIFFCDQDDIWLAEKIEVMTHIMEDKNAGVVFGNSVFVDGFGKEIVRKNRNSGVNELTHMNFDNKFNTKMFLGCRMCISRQIVDQYISLNIPDFSFDTQCGRLGLLFSSVYVLNRPVIKYRIHGANNSGINDEYTYGSSNLEFRINETRANINWLQKILEFVNSDTSSFDLPEEKCELIDRLIKMQTERVSYLDNRGVRFTNLLKYKKNYSGFSMLVGDFAYKHKINILLGKVRSKM